MIKTEEENFENVQVENVETVATEIQHEGISFIEEDDSLESTEGDIEKFNEASEKYRQTKITQDFTFIDPATGEVIDRSQLSPFEQIKQMAKTIGQTINEPNKNCKHCYGRGYTGINLDGNVPVACDCIYKEWYKENPKKNQNFFPENRKTKRYYGKQMQQYVQKLAKLERAKLEVIENSKKNLRKNTPVSDTVVEEVHVETAEGTI